MVLQMFFFFSSPSNTFETDIITNLCLVNNHIQSAPGLLVKIRCGSIVVKIIDCIRLHLSLDKTSKSYLKHSNFSEAQHIMRSLFVLYSNQPYVRFQAKSISRNEERKSEDLKSLNFAAFQSVIIVYK